MLDSGVTYLSFPISEPREMEAKGDLSFVDLINQAHQLAASEMKSDRSRTFISPLSIDELPISRHARQAGSGKSFSFDCFADRWNVEDLWGAKEPTLLPPIKGPRQFDADKVKEASGVISTDVGWRDRRLVLQSKCLAVVCPKPPAEERITRGVEDEVSVATAQNIVSYWWQKPEWDQNNWVQNVHWRAAGSMGIGQAQVLVKQVASLAELVRSKP